MNLGSSIQVWKIRQTSLGWGDWGHYLVMARAPAWEDDQLEPCPINRLGPFVPPLYTAIPYVFISDECRSKVESDFGNRIRLRPVRYKEIGLSDWHEWDPKAKEPRFYPRSGTPFGYYEEATPASNEEIAAMIPSWQIITQAVPSRFRWVNGPDTETVLHITADAFQRADRLGIFTDSFSATSKMVTPWAKQALADIFGRWIHFERVEVRIEQ